MIRSETVIVVGAGASCDLGFPSGGQLLEQIRDDLDIRFEWDRQKSGDLALNAAFKLLHVDERNRHDQAKVHAMVLAGHRIRDAAVGGDSIDNVIDQADDDPVVAEVGKLAIALQIMRAEKGSMLAKPPHELAEIDIAAQGSHWLAQLMRLARADVKRSEVDKIFEKLTIITFNYDRTLEAYLPVALARAYNLSEAEARQCAARLPIFHPYGDVGHLAWLAPTGTQPVPFGSFTTQQLPQIAANIRTFGEQMEEGDELQQIRQAVAQAKNIVFLGFGFHRQNMRLLQPPVNTVGKHFYGTSYGLPSPAIGAVESMIEELGGPSPGGARSVQLAATKCAPFLADHFLPLTA